MFKTLFALLVVLGVATLSPQAVRGDALLWPTNQLLPTFPAPAATLDCIDVSSASSAELDLFASLEGIVNRAQPRIACVSSVDGEGKFTWLNLHNLPYSLINGYSAISKYQTNVTGLVVTDPSQPDTLNLATTIAGVSNLLICDPSLLPTLTGAPYNLSVAQDLRGRFSNKYQVYGYLYTNYWPQCTHRMISGLYTNIHGELRDYEVAVKCATVWLDPGPLNFSDKSTLALFLNDMTALNGVYTGWWPNEGNGLGWIAQYGIPVLASDYFRNASVFSGLPRTVNVPDIPPPPPLANKVYVAMLLSDGDNIQYMQHVMKMDWDNTVRGTVPIGWTVSPLAADFDPVMLNHYWNTATSNDCLISGPSGAGYSHIESWNSANLAALTRVSDSYLRRSGLRIITIWDQVTTGVAQSFATNCGTLFGLTDQSGGTYTSTNLGLRTIGLTVTYSSATSDIINGITNAAKNWNGSAPLFLAVQANVWNIGPSDLRNIANSLDPNEYVFVRPDHLFLLYNRVNGMPVAMTKSSGGVAGSSATLQGSVIPNAPSAAVWFDWGTNSSYGSRSTVTNTAGNSIVTVRTAIGGLQPRVVYHYRVAVSNALGIAWGADQVLTTGGRIKAWGDGSFGQTNVPSLTNVIAVSCGANHALALKNDSSVVAWGLNSLGQTNVPPGLTSIVEISGGVQHSLALSTSGSVTAWGDNTYGQTNIPAGLANVVDIAAGGYHNLALKADGTVAAWGYSAHGETNVPAGLSNVTAVAAGRYHSLALKADGTVVSWGYNGFGETNVPLGLAKVCSVSAGDYHSLALKADGLSSPNFFPARRWTADSLGGVDGSSVSTWTDSSSGRNATQVNAANRPQLYSNVINGHKTVRFSSGSSQYLTVASTDSPISAAGSFTAVVVFKTSTPGNSSSLFYQNTGLLGCEQPNVVADWALCINGSQLGAGLGAGSGGCGSDLSLYGGNVTDGNAHIAMYVRSGGTINLYVDGSIVAAQTSLCPAARGDYNFQIGAMTSSSYFFNGDIAEIQLYDRALNSWEIMSVNETLAGTYGIGGTARRLVAWGYDSYGQTDIAPALTNLTLTACGSAFNLGLRSDGSAVAWGNNANGQTNFPRGLTNVAALAGGQSFALAIANQTPLVNDASFSGFIDHDLTLVLPGSDPDGNPFSFSVVSLPSSGALYQYSAGSRGAPITAPNTIVTDSSGRLVFAPASETTGSPYANFGFMAADAFYNSGTAKVTVNIGMPTAPQFTGQFWNSVNQSFNLTFSGSPNASYSLWASTNLTDWTNIGPATEASPGNYQFLDATTTNYPSRLYRVSGP